LTFHLSIDSKQMLKCDGSIVLCDRLKCVSIVTQIITQIIFEIVACSLVSNTVKANKHEINKRKTGQTGTSPTGLHAV